MFAKYVPYETIYRATFNYWEPSHLIDKDKKRYTVYHTKYPVKPEPNLVVIEANDDPKELYFRAFLGRHSGECETVSEAQPFLDELRRTISPEFRVKGKDLERQIIAVLDQVDAKRIKF
jgi:hypothetical protein